MTVPAYSSVAQWYTDGDRAHFIRTIKSAGRILDLLEAVRPAGVMSRPGVPDLVLSEDMLGGRRVVGNLGAGRFDVRSERGDLYFAPPNFANTVGVDSSFHMRSLAFPMAEWKEVLDDATEGSFTVEGLRLDKGSFSAPAIQSALRKLWALCDQEGAPSRMLARAAGCEILAELCRLSGAPFAPAKGGLAPWAQRRSLEHIQARLSEDISLDELATEAQPLAISFRTHVQAERRRAATGLPDAPQNGESLRTPRARQTFRSRRSPWRSGTRRIRSSPGYSPSIGR